LVCNKRAMDALAAGVDPRRIADDWRDDVDNFIKLRKKYLIY